ncbi:MAG: hypothetical protein RR738_04715 [Anaerorhabdus sp.]|uniref:hypothetical protein n=1 Tax=Anaerorhabdus sp. TaxID=1872524 RepID=UPI002FC68DA3
MQTKLERLNLYYWRKKDIAVVLNIQHETACKLFDAAMKQMKQENEFIVHDNKVEQRIVLKIANINANFLRKQIESEEAQKKSSTLEK